MIVKDKKESIKKAYDIANKMMKLFCDEIVSFEDGGDPAEQIYLTAHTVAELNLNFYMSMDAMGKIYGIKSFDGKVFESFVNEIKKERMLQNESTSDNVVEQLKEENLIN